jgi:hypothetical protein
MPKGEPRQHHYVPVFYQKHFADAEGLVWVYDRKSKVYKHLHPKVVCSANDFYTIFSKDGGQIRTVESEFMAPLDQIASVALNKIAAGQWSSPEIVEAVSGLIGVQRTRTPSFRRAVSALIGANLEQYIRIGFSDVERARQLIANYEKGTGEKMGPIAEELVEVVRSGGISVEATETGFLSLMTGAARDLAEVVNRVRWCVLEAPAKTGFITCDDPFVTVPPPSNKDNGVGIALPGSKSYFPLTRRFCLEVEPLPHTVTGRKTGAHGTRLINKNIAANSDRFILGPDESQLRAIVNSSGSAEMDSDRMDVDVPQSDSNSASVRIQARRRRYFY